MKTCTACGETKPLAEFRMRNKTTEQRHSRCNGCQAGYRRQHYLNNRQKYIDKSKQSTGALRARNRAQVVEHLMSNPCIDCGETDIEVLQFDHVEPLLSKRGRIHEYLSGSVSRLQEEIAKCEIRCANCHLRRTRRMQGWSYEN